MKRPYLTKEQIQAKILDPDFQKSKFSEAQVKRLIDVIKRDEAIKDSKSAVRS